MERTTLKDYNQSGFTTLPVPEFKQGDFSSLFDSGFTGNNNSGAMVGTDAAGRSVRFGSIYDPSSSRQVGNSRVRDIFPGNVIPKSRWSPVSSKILELAPIDDPTLPGMLRNIPAIGNLLSGVPRTDDYL